MKEAVKSIIGKLPLRIKNRFINLLENSLSIEERLQLGRNDTFLSLRRLALYDFKPSYVIDVGAHVGEWTKKVYAIFPTASFVAVEALPDKKQILQKAFKYLPVKIYNNLLGDSSKKDVPFFTMETGSSVLPELTNFSRDVIYLDMLTLDEVAEKENFQGSILLKLDVQGFELEVLKGATLVLNKVDVICLELSFLNYNEGAPLAHEVIQKMKDLNFLTWDITGFMRKDSDFGLIQSDFIFIKSNSTIRNRMNNLKENFKILSS